MCANKNDKAADQHTPIVTFGYIELNPRASAPAESINAPAHSREGVDQVQIVGAAKSKRRPDFFYKHSVYKQNIKLLYKLTLTINLYHKRSRLET